MSFQEHSIKYINSIYPPKIRRGDIVGIISPASPVEKATLFPGLHILESAGFQVKLAPHVLAKKGYLAGDDQKRLDDFHDMFRNHSIKAIFCSRGGYGCMRLIDKIDYQLVRQNPKILVGYSDITALLMAIYKNTALVTLHAPVVKDFILEKEENWKRLLEFILSPRPFDISLKGGIIITNGKARGPLIGGNLSLICHILNTPYSPSFEGCVLFLEEYREPLYRIDRMLTYLIISQHLNKLAGIVIGDFEDCGDQLKVNELIREKLLPLSIPCATGLPVGHGSINQTLPIGALAELDTDIMSLSILKPAITV